MCKGQSSEGTVQSSLFTVSQGAQLYHMRATESRDADNHVHVSQDVVNLVHEDQSNQETIIIIIHDEPRDYYRHCLRLAKGLNFTTQESPTQEMWVPIFV